MITKKSFGKIGAREILLYTISSDELSVSVSTYGATVQAIVFDGIDVVLGYNSLEEYLPGTGYVGVTVGRVANRIKDASIEINGIEYPLSKNEGNNQLHGGFHGLDKEIYEAKEIDNGVALRCCSNDGVDGYPGNLDLEIRFTVIGNKLQIAYLAKCDKESVFAPSAHIYFNMNGEVGNAHSNKITIYADKYTPVDGCLIPLAEDLPVEGTAYDFRMGKAIAKDIGIVGGYDNNFILNSNHACTLVGDVSGIQMDMYTNMPGLQMYSGIHSLAPRQGKRKSYFKAEGIALEPQFVPDAFHSDVHEKPYIHPGKPVEYTAEFVFSK